MAVDAHSEAEFRALVDSNRYAVLNFYVTWARPCKLSDPIFRDLADRYSIPGSLTFIRLDGDEVGDLAATYNVRSLPVFIFLKDGQLLPITDSGESNVTGNLPGLLTSLSERINTMAQAVE